MNKAYARKKVVIVRKILIQLQNLLQIVERKSTKYEENRRLITKLEQLLDDVKKDLREKEETLSHSIEKIWTGIEETAMCLKGLEDLPEGKNKENSENDVYQPCYSSLDDIVGQHYQWKFHRWNKLRNKLDDLEKKREENFPYEPGRQWEVIKFSFDSSDDVVPVGDPFVKPPVKRQKLQNEPEEEQQTENLERQASSKEEAEDDEKFAKFLEEEARRLKKKKKKKLRMVLKQKDLNPAKNAKKTIEKNDSQESSQCLALVPVPVLQELSFNRELVSIPASSPTSPEPSTSNPEILPSPDDAQEIILLNMKKYIDPAVDAFEHMNLVESLVSGINLWGISVPNTLERRAVPAFLSGADMVLEGPPRSGKTTSASIGVLNKLDEGLKKPQAIFVFPSADAAEKTMKTMGDLGTLMDLQQCCCKCIEDVETSQVFLGTPTSIHNLISSRRLVVDFVKIMVIDDAQDLTAESQSLVLQVLYGLPGNSQFVMLTRRISPEVASLSLKMRNPVHLNANVYETEANLVLESFSPLSVSESPPVVMEEIENENPRLPTPAPTIDFENMNQFYVIVETDELKIRVLAALADTMETEQAIIFCNSPQKADWLARKIRENEKGLEVCSVHGGRQNRDHLITLFQAGVSRVLITTDFIARCNVRVKPVPLVLNYEFPEVPENYTQRIACAGRTRKSAALDEAGGSSVPVLVFTFVTSQNLPQLESLARKYNFAVTPMSSQQC